MIVVIVDVSLLSCSQYPTTITTYGPPVPEWTLTISEFWFLFNDNSDVTVLIANV